jgi:hypothetical protein
MHYVPKKIADLESVSGPDRDPDPWRIWKVGSGINHSGSTTLDDRNFRSFTCTFLARGPAEGKRGKRIWEEKSSIPGK